VKRTQNFSKAVFNLSISSGGRLVFASKTRMGIHFPGCWTYRLVKTLTTGTSSAASRARDSELSAKLSQSAASFNQATLSCGLAALAAIWRHSSASRRNLSESESVIAAEYAQSSTDDTSPKVAGDKASLVCPRSATVSALLSNWKPIATNAESDSRRGTVH
jgi:hypothetical protein